MGGYPSFNAHSAAAQPQVMNPESIAQARSIFGGDTSLKVKEQPIDQLTQQTTMIKQDECSQLSLAANQAHNQSSSIVHTQQTQQTMQPSQTNSSSSQQPVQPQPTSALKQRRKPLPKAPPIGALSAPVDPENYKKLVPTTHRYHALLKATVLSLTFDQLPSCKDTVIKRLWLLFHGRGLSHPEDLTHCIDQDALNKHNLAYH